MEEQDWVAQLDQALRGITDVARVMRTYYVALVEQGFTNVEAMALTVAYQAVLVGSSSHPEE